MRITFYLIRHAQSVQKASEASSHWRLSTVGASQAKKLAELLTPLGIQRVLSSPFTRSLQTAAPFAEKHALEIGIVDDLRERILQTDPSHDSDELWRKSWEDFAFAAPGCESSLAAQKRICSAMGAIAAENRGTTAVFSHGHVIALFLNAIEKSVGRTEAELLMNPDVLRVEWKNGSFFWDREFRLHGLAAIATTHEQTPKDEEPNQAPEPTPPAARSAVADL
jgi:2,3-bisphosphoglycerate-dependent phosphoglycerate mutase